MHPMRAWNPTLRSTSGATYRWNGLDALYAMHFESLNLSAYYAVGTLISDPVDN